jgi:hypothetical protein
MRRIVLSVKTIRRSALRLSALVVLLKKMFQAEDADVRDFNIDFNCKECAATNGLIPKQAFIPWLALKL